MTTVNGFPPPRHLPYLLDLAHRRMQRDLADLVDARAFPGVRGSHFRILSMIPVAGARPSALAATAQVTRPALGELVRHLEEHGYVSTEADTSDGRAVLVVPTARGRRAAAAADSAIAELKRRWAREVGSAELEVMLDTLAALTVERSAPV